MDETEDIRRQLVAEVNAKAHTRSSLESEHGQVWDTDELCRDFEVEGFLAPVVVVKRRSDGKKGSLMFVHRPRFYFGFQED